VRPGGLDSAATAGVAELLEMGTVEEWTSLRLGRLAEGEELMGLLERGSSQKSLKVSTLWGTMCSEKTQSCSNLSDLGSS